MKKYTIIQFDMFSLQKFLKLKIVATFPVMYGENTITNPIYYPTSFFPHTIHIHYILRHNIIMYIYYMYIIILCRNIIIRPYILPFTTHSFPCPQVPT